MKVPSIALLRIGLASSGSGGAEISIPEERLAREAFRLLETLNGNDRGLTCPRPLTEEERAKELKARAVFGCMTEVCGGYFEKYPTPLSVSNEFDRKLGAAKKDLFEQINADKIKKIKDGLNYWADLLKQELTRPEPRPLTDDEKFEAGLRLAGTDCEVVACTEQIKKRVQVYRQTRSGVRFLHALKGKPVSSSELQKALEDFKRTYPGLYEVKRVFWDEQREKAKKAGVDHSPAFLYLQTIVALAKDPEARKTLVDELPTPQAAWAGQEGQLSEVARNFDDYFKSCMDNVASRMALEPSPSETRHFIDKTVPETKKKVAQLLGRNFSKKSSKVLSGAVMGTRADAPNERNTQRFFQKRLDHEAEFWGRPATEPKRRFLAAYVIDHADWLANRCRELSEQGADEDADGFVRDQRAIQVSAKTVKRGSIEVFAHELMHVAEAAFEDAERGAISSTSRETKEKIDGCLAGKIERLGAGSFDTTEDFADLGIAAIADREAMCDIFKGGALNADIQQALAKRSSEGHARPLYRVLHLRSYDSHPLPLNCQRALELSGVPDLFEERCMKP